ncbi:MAG: hypothetical protein BWY96_03064 [Spirochaetes bacterium ADurb.BinA120]|nr:MAG: hypothetical protein BWY96_03064 [Spirochaetes bacterium ADurb.BinA120]
MVPESAPIDAGGAFFSASRTSVSASKSISTPGKPFRLRSAKSPSIRPAVSSAERRATASAESFAPRSRHSSIAAEKAFRSSIHAASPATIASREAIRQAVHWFISRFCCAVQSRAPRLWINPTVSIQRSLRSSNLARSSAHCFSWISEFWAMSPLTMRCCTAIPSALRTISVTIAR